MSTRNTNKIDQNEIDFFSRFYVGNHYNLVGWRLRLQREINLISKLASSHNKEFGRVLSVGCGAGQFEIMLAPFADEIIGIDLSPEAITLAANSAAEAGIKNVRFECASVNDYRWEGKFDSVIALAFFHHIPASELPGLVKSLAGNLRPGGIIYSSDPNKKALLRWFGRLLMGGSYDKFHSPDERELVPQEMMGMLCDAGFEKSLLCWADFTLIPALFILKNGPNWPLYFAKWLDTILLNTPLRFLASGFALFGIKPERL